ncbi:glycoside hydrolase family 43 protein [Chitinophagaceae bacterium MMS25-I14]
MMKRLINLLAPGLCFFLLRPAAGAQQRYVSEVWSPDKGNGTYINPVINADYSDPDVIRTGDDYYLVASSFDAVPGLPILHSKDLVNWEIQSYALARLVPDAHFSQTQHGNGVWAPAIRFHNGFYYIYYPDPDFGIYMIKSERATGPWSVPVMVLPGKGLIDPCPLWDDDGKVYLVHAFAGSRAGIKSIIAIKELNAAGTEVIGEGQIVYDGHHIDPTIEGPKLYRRNGYYYIFAPAGGVSAGWQVVLRSKNIYGPYRRKVVMEQGTTHINGPHQGAWVDTRTGQHWFLHFQDKGPYGRVVHLQPMHWVNDWPVIGADSDGDGKGTPVASYTMPDIGKKYPVVNPAESDEFNGSTPGFQWQWQANPQASWLFMDNEGHMRLYAIKAPDSAQNCWGIPNLLLQKFPATSFTATVKMEFNPNPGKGSERAGIIIMGNSYACLTLKSSEKGADLVYATCENADLGTPEQESVIISYKGGPLYLRVKVAAGAICSFSYSTNGNNYTDAGAAFNATAGRWIGAKVGLFCSGKYHTNDAGYASFDWFRITP